jgi:hypothetical protein
VISIQHDVEQRRNHDQDAAYDRKRRDAPTHEHGAWMLKLLCEATSFFRLPAGIYFVRKMPSNGAGGAEPLHLILRLRINAGWLA